MGTILNKGPIQVGFRKKNHLCNKESLTFYYFTLSFIQTIRIMEGKELNKDDDQLKSGSDESTNEGSDDFGLPEAPFDDQKEEISEETESYDFSTGDSIYEREDSDKSYVADTSDDDESRTPVGLIVTLVLIGVIAIVIAAYFLFFKKDKEPVVQEKPTPAVVDSTLLETPIEEPVVEEPEIEPEPAIPEPGEYQVLTAKTGSYYVVIASFIDSDLAEDYAKKLSVNSVGSTILSPEGKGFFRLAIGREYSSFADASMEIETVRGNYGPEVWVFKY